MPIPSLSWTHALLAAAGIVLASLPCAAVEPATPLVKKPDWASLDGLLQAGDYEQAATAAGELATALKPKRNDPEFLVRSIGWFRALLRRGFAEFRLGKLDDAAATFELARRIPRDADFRRLLTIELRSANAKTMTTIIPLDINAVELLDLQMLVLLERLRCVNLDPGAEGPQSTEQEAALRAQVAEWLDDLDAIAKTAVKARSELAERLDKGDAALLASPHNRALTGDFWPEFLDGIKALELSRLPFGDPRDEASAQPQADAAPARAWLAEARRHFAAAAAALDAAIAAAAPKGAAAMKPEHTSEVLRMRADLLVREGELRLAAGDPSGARERFAQAAEFLRQSAVLRKVKNPDAHPDLFVPLLLGAESMLDEAQRDAAAGAPARARKTIVEAEKLVSRAAELSFPREHHLRTKLARVQALLGDELAQVGERLPGADAADVAARRLQRALDGAAVSSDLVSP